MAHQSLALWSLVSLQLQIGRKNTTYKNVLLAFVTETVESKKVTQPYSRALSGILHGNTHFCLLNKFYFTILYHIAFV